MKHLILLSLIVTLTAGCVAHLTQQQCLTMNWQDVGFQDGAAGKPASDLSAETKDCAKFNIAVNNQRYHTGWIQGAKQYCSPDAKVGYVDGAAGKPVVEIYNRMPICQQAGIKLNLATYNAGRQTGLKTFCTFENGANFARQGALLPEVCPPQLNANFSSGWATGREQLCNHPKNGFALGKSLKSYPAICSPEIYAAFASEYHRGEVIGQRILALHIKIDPLNEKIAAKVNRYSFVRNVNGNYDLDGDGSNDAKEALGTVKSMVKEKQPYERELFLLEVMK